MSKKTSAVPQHYATAKRSYKPAQTAEPGFTLHKLDPDDFHEAVGLVENVKTMIPDREESDELTYGLGVGDSVGSPDGQRGTITGFAVDVDTGKVSAFARLNGRLYHASTLRRSR